ncbi:hypothetical protein ILYODFUR_005890 [Ilyodon furcidens]|uniref:Uncharacterized protein n=1 Tax=Ilyodon furcidens TaxID=33524 RepID=A0ABV0UPE8_9TELE
MSGKKALLRHDLDKTHRAAVKALQHTCMLPGATSKKEIFSEFQSLLHLPPKSPVRPISSRFLQMLDVRTRVEELIDVLVVYYYYVVPPNEEHKYRWMITQVLQRNAVSVEERPRIELLQRQQATASRAGTQANRDRKAQISVLFTEYERLIFVIDIFRAVFTVEGGL